MTLSLEQRDGRACLIVEDTGIGIPEEEQSRIFERFYRSQAALSRGEGGHGLGLCITRSIVETHGGKIEIDSAPGRGSKFTLLLPLAPEGRKELTPHRGHRGTGRQGGPGDSV